MPCCVVYQDTTDSRQLETNRLTTSGRRTAAWPAEDEGTNAGHGTSRKGQRARAARFEESLDAARPGPERLAPCASRRRGR